MLAFLLPKKTAQIDTSSKGLLQSEHSKANRGAIRGRTA
jgi:hypothetical protein